MTMMVCQVSAQRETPKGKRLVRVCALPQEPVCGLSRSAPRSDQISGAQSLVLKQRGLFPVGDSRALLRLDRS